MRCPAMTALLFPAARLRRFGIRIFEPVVMPQPHWHGHIELNFAVNFRIPMTSTHPSEPCPRTG